MLPDLNYVVLMKVGSHLYGTDTPESDTDYKGVYLPEQKDIILQQVEPSLPKSKGSKEPGVKNTKDDVDVEVYSLQKYLSLLAKGDTNATDMLFCPDEMLVKTSPTWDKIRLNANKVLNQKIIAFSHYCKKQADKYSLKGDRLKTVKDSLRLFGVKLFDAGFQPKYAKLADFMDDYLKEMGHLEFVSHGIDEHTGSPIRYLEINNRKFHETVKMDYLIESLEKVRDTYKARTQAAEAAGGVDWKALSHAFRVCMEGIELFTTGKITLPLEECTRSVVFKIKTGEYDYETVSRLIDSALSRLENLQAEGNVPLRKEPDMYWVESFVYEEYMNVIRKPLKERG